MNPEQYLAWIAQGGIQGERGLKQLFDLYAARIKTFYRRRGCSDEDAADLLQETFIKVFRSAGQFRSDAKVSTWIWSITRNCLIDHWRAKDPASSLDALMEEGDSEWELAVGSVEPAHESLDLSNCVQQAFLEFAGRHPGNAQALQLATVEGWTMEELGEFLGRTANATKEFVSQCKKRLKPFLQRCKEFLNP
jgi:RNA polymerase sigma-70 factor (ECF subfamily)